MSEYVYAIVEAGAAAPSGPGVGGAALRVIAGEEVAVLVSELSTEHARLGRDAILTHSRVLADALSEGTVLPMRFGTVFADPEAVRIELLEEQGPALREELDRLAGKVELSVRAIYEEEPLMREIVRENPDVARLGRSLRGKPEDATYFGRIQLGELIADAITRRRERDAEMILGELSPMSIAVRVAEPGHERAVLSASFLVERERVPEFDDALEDIASEQSERMRFKLTGPLAPHSFVELAGRE